MLSRVADAIYWMSRNLERAENIARFIEVNWHMSLDYHNGRELAQWEPLVNVTGDGEVFFKHYDIASQNNVINFLAMNTEYSNSIISCLANARENARAVREIISTELWEQINTFYHFVKSAGNNQTDIFENPYGFCKEVQLRGMMLGGITNDTMDHGEAWHFFHLGRYLERADKTSRILDVKYFILLPNLDYVGTTYDDIQWAALLRSTDGLNAYRQRYGRIVPKHIVQFLMLGRRFPRAVLHCSVQAQKSLHSISSSKLGTYQNEAERHLGQLCAELSYTTTQTIFAKGLHEFTDQLQLDMNKVDIAIAETFFGATFD